MIEKIDKMIIVAVKCSICNKKYRISKIKAESKDFRNACSIRCMNKYEGITMVVE